MKNALVVGSKEKFAIEYSRGSDPKLGFVRLWLNNVYLGAEEDETYFSYVQGDLHHLLNNVKKLGDFSYNDEHPENIIDLVINMKNESDNSSMDKYVTSFGDAFDDFFIVCFFVNSKIHFVWKLRNNPHFEYPDYPKEAQMYSVEIEKFKEIVSQFDKSLSLWP